jgi:hypothetical protein
MPEHYHAGGMTRTEAQVNFICIPTNITGQPVDPRQQSTKTIQMVYCLSTLMKWRQYITLLGTSSNVVMNWEGTNLDG